MLRLALQSTRGRRTKPNLWPDSHTGLSLLTRRSETEHEGVTGQIQCDFSLFDVFLLVVVQSKCSNCTFCSQNATWVSDWSVGCDWQEEDCLFCPKPKDVQLIIPRSINGLPINQISKWLLVRILEKLRVQDVRGFFVICLNSGKTANKTWVRRLELEAD